MRITSPVLGKFSRRQFLRAPLISKQANKNFYKGKGGRRIGVHTGKGQYHVHQHRLTEIVAPDLTGYALKPYVSHATPLVKYERNDSTAESRS